MKTFFFSATGSNPYVAKQIGGTLISIHQVLKERLTSFEDDQIVFVIPC